MKHRRNFVWSRALLTGRVVCLCFPLFLVLLAGGALATDLAEIDLVDGSTIRGEIVSINHGVYTLRSPALGTIEVDGARIRAIRPKPASTGGDKNAGVPSTEGLRESLANNEELMNLILSLQDDSDMQEVLRDPSIVTAVNSGDIGALMSNPKFMKLLENPKVQEIQRKSTTR